MSFLDSVLSSLETGKPSPIPPRSQPPAPSIASSTTKPEPRKPGMGPAPNHETPSTGTKRKADEQLQPRAKPGSQLPSRPTASKPSTASTASKPRPNPMSTKPQPNMATPAAQKPSAVSSKPPPKGSFADLMAKAKDLQQNASTNVGMLKHQSVPKERLSKVERRKRIMEARAKEKDARSGKKNATGSVGGAPARKRDPEEPSYKGTARPTQPAQPAYRGTAGLPTKRDPKDRKALHGKRSRLDDYLGTDEEDEGDYADDYDDYYSESSDMEAGMDDVELEEASALKAAQREDEEEWQAEQAAKKAKMERRNKLAALSSKSR